MTTLRLLLVVMATEDLELEQLDVKMAFLHEDLEEDIYMPQPTSFSVTGEKSHLVCRLKKSLHGLKQATRMCYQKFDFLHPAAWLPPVRLRPMHVHLTTGRRVLDLSDSICQTEIGKLKLSLHDKFTMKNSDKPIKFWA